jgi:endonuclease/exonuclease/phosphatase (EEP) superfamily protein YafD
VKVIGSLCRWTGFCSGLGALFIVVMALASPLGWPFELFASWPYLAGAIGLLGAIVLGLTGRGRLSTATIAGTLIVVALAMASPGDLTRPVAPKPDPKNRHLIWGNAMRIEANVLNLMARSVTPTQPVLAIGEIPSNWAWQPLPERQSLNRVKAGDGRIGIGVEGCAATRETFTTTSVRAGQTRVRTYALKVQCPDYTLFAVHLTNPLWEWGKRHVRRNQELEQLAAAVAAEKGPVVVVGDFNTSPNVVPFSRFIRQSKLDRTACGGRWVPTWRPLGWREKFKDGNPLTGIPIDHLFTRDVQVVSCIVGKDFGSDHLPLIIEFKPIAGATTP